MILNCKIVMPTAAELLAKKGLGEGGRAQKYVDSAVIRLMKPYTPRLERALEQSATIGTVIGSGEIKQDTPYSRYQYYGKLMVSSVTGSAWARANEPKKVLTDIDLQHQKSRNPLAGSHWFERMKADHKAEILRGAAKLTGGEVQ